MKFGRSACKAAIAVCAALITAASAWAADLSALHAWVGKYPFDRVGKHRFFDHPGLRDEMRKTMGAEAYRALQQIKGPANPVVRVGDHIAAWQCMAHDCGDKNTTIIARLAKGDVVVCWQHAPERPSARWYVPGRAPVDEPGGNGCPSDAKEIGAAIRRLGL